MISIIDYGYGNIFSVVSALKKLGFNPLVTSDYKVIEKSNIIIFPGVGSFNQAISELKKKKLDVAIHKAVKNGSGIIGICLGYQMLFDESQENGIFKGLGLIKGKVKSLMSINPNFKRVPNIGWRLLIPNLENDQKVYYSKNSFVYFVHSFVPVVKNKKDVSAFINFDGCKIHAAVHSNRIIGYQYHPEKSGEIGLKILYNSIKALS